MTSLSLVTGAVLGLSVAAPFGPVSLLCVQRSIAAGIRQGVATGFGAACVHGFYASVAIIGAGTVARYVAAWDQPVRLLSGLLLVVLGIRTLLRRAPIRQSVRLVRTHHAFASSAAIALSNPLTITPYLLVASGQAAGAAAVVELTAWSIPGVLAGAAAWYSGISTCAGICRAGITPGAVRVLNNVAAAFLIGFGLRIALG